MLKWSVMYMKISLGQSLAQTAFTLPLEMLKSSFWHARALNRETNDQYNLFLMNFRTPSSEIQ